MQATLQNIFSGRLFGEEWGEEEWMRWPHLQLGKSKVTSPCFSVDKKLFLAWPDIYRLWHNLYEKHGCTQLPCYCHAPNVPLNSWDFCCGRWSKSWQTQLLGFLLLMVWIHITVTEQQVRLAYRKLVWCCLQYETSWNHTSVQSNNVVSISQTKTWEQRLGLWWKKMEGHLRCSYRSVAYVFLWYLFTDIYCWDRRGETVACHQGRRYCYVWSIGMAELGSERDKAAESCQPWEGEDSPHRSGVWPRGRIRGHSGQKVMSNDGSWRLQEKRSDIQEKGRVEPDGLRLCMH